MSRSDIDKLKKSWIIWRGPLDQALQMLKVKQAAHVGNRSDKNLALIDKYKNLKAFTYAGTIVLKFL